MNNITSVEGTLYNVFLSGGIPLTLVINVTVCLFLILLFVCCIRRLPLYNSNYKRALIHEVREEEPNRQQNENNQQPIIGSHWVAVPTTTTEEQDNEIKRVNNVDMKRGSASASQNQNICLTGCMLLQNLFCCLCCPNREAKRSTNDYGRDTAVYLNYQTVFVYCSFVLAAVGIAVLIPVHITGTLPKYYSIDSCQNGTFRSLNATSPIIIASPPTTQRPTSTTRSPSPTTPAGTQLTSTIIPTTNSPTISPTILPISTNPTSTDIPTTIAPTTNGPATIGPITAAPSTIAPTGAATTEAPQSIAPTTVTPTDTVPVSTIAPITDAPVTIAPTTIAPTLAPVTNPPTDTPTTLEPITTLEPATTLEPTTTTLEPTTTTLEPTTTTLTPTTTLEPTTTTTLEPTTTSSETLFPVVGTCNGVPATDPTVCSGYGTCAACYTGYCCQCAETYTGNNCEYRTCFGKTFPDDTVCSGYGQCVGYNQCLCSNGYTGDECQIPPLTCNGKLATDPTVCSGYGQCTAQGTCACVDTAYGVDCEYDVPTTCSGYAPDDPQVCSGNGACIACPDHPGVCCTCNAGWVGFECQTPAKRNVLRYHMATNTTTAPTRVTTSTPTKTSTQRQLGQGLNSNDNKMNNPDFFPCQARTNITYASDVYYTFSTVNMVMTSPTMTYVHAAMTAANIGIVLVALAIFGCLPLVRKFNFAGADHRFANQLLQMTNLRIPQRQEPKSKSHLAYLASPYAVEIRGIPRNLIDSKKFFSLCKDYTAGDDDIIKACIIVDMGDLAALQAKHEKNDVKVEQWKTEWMLAGGLEENRPRKLFPFSKDRPEVDAIAFYEGKCTYYKTEIEHWYHCYECALDGEPATDSRYEIQGSGYGYVIFRSTAHRNEFLRNVNKKHLVRASSTGNNYETIAHLNVHCRPTRYETGDMLWQNIFNYHRGGTHGTLKKSLILLALLAIVIFISIPMAALSGLQYLFEFGILTPNEIATTGYLGAFLLQYLPSFVLFLAMLFAPKLIIWYTVQNSSYITHGSVHRAVIRRTYFYLLFAALIVPSIVLAVMDGVVKASIQTRRDWSEIFALVFLPTSGAFFANFVSHKALIKNALDLYNFRALFKFLASTKFMSKWKHMSKIERLASVEKIDFHMETEYAYMLVVMVMGLCLGLYIPMMLLVALIYFVGKFFIDRIVVRYMYSHRKDQRTRKTLYGHGYGTPKSDFLSHRKTVQLLIKLTLLNLCIFCTYMIVFYALKVASDIYFIPHICIAGALGFICFGISLVYLSYVWFKANSAKTLHQTNVQQEQPEPTAELVATKYEPVFFNPPVKLKQDAVINDSGTLQKVERIQSPGASFV